jgi:hypothetical protein
MIAWDRMKTSNLPRDMNQVMPLLRWSSCLLEYNFAAVSSVSSVFHLHWGGCAGRDCRALMTEQAGLAHKGQMLRCERLRLPGVGNCSE